MSSPFNPLTPSLLQAGTGGTPRDFLPGFGLLNSPQPGTGLSPIPGTSPWFQLHNPGSAGSFGLPGLNALSAPASNPANPFANLGTVGVVGGALGSVGGVAGVGPQGGALGGAGLVAPPTHTVPASTDLDDALRVFPEIMRRLERAEMLRAECQQLEERAFREPVDSRIEGAQLEYAQTLLELISLTGTYLVGALPLAEPAIGPATPLADLAAWTEQRAETQFAKREAVKDAAKAVVEVLSKRD